MAILLAVMIDSAYLFSDHPVLYFKHIDDLKCKKAYLFLFNKINQRKLVICSDISTDQYSYLCVFSYVPVLRFGL